MTQEQALQRAREILPHAKVVYPAEVMREGELRQSVVAVIPPGRTLLSSLTRLEMVLSPAGADVEYDPQWGDRALKVICWGMNYVG